MTALPGAPGLVLEEQGLKILDFDIEASPGAWFGGDFVTKRLLAIAATWVVNGAPTEVQCMTRQGRKRTTEKMLRWFTRLYDEADLVTGHFIRGYDLPVLQGAMIRYGLPLLGQKLTQDTKLDMAKSTGISKSQENLGALAKLDHAKFTMNTVLWEEAGDLTPEGLEIVRQRAMGDVIQHVELREKFLSRGVLARPRVWTPTATGKSSRYVG